MWSVSTSLVAYFCHMHYFSGKLQRPLDLYWTFFFFFNRMLVFLLGLFSIKWKQKNSKQTRIVSLKCYFSIDLQVLSSWTLGLNLVCFPIFTIFLFCDYWLKWTCRKVYCEHSKFQLWTGWLSVLVVTLGLSTTIFWYYLKHTHFSHIQYLHYFSSNSVFQKQ